MIEFLNVTKEYGSTVALDNFSISIDESGIYCLLGRNGAGKTTMLKALAGHIATTHGEVRVNGSAVKRLAMPDEVHFVSADAAQFNIKLGGLFEAAAEINPNFDTDLAARMAGRFKLDLGKRFGQLSFGMKAMANALIALSSGRSILLLDEPVLGFDPVMRRTFYELLEESCAERPRTVIVSTHIIDEIARVAQRLIIIDRGRLKLFCDMAEIDEMSYCVTGPAANVERATAGLNIIGETRTGGYLSRMIYDGRIDESDEYSISALSLQDFFVGLVGGDEEGILYEDRVRHG